MDSVLRVYASLRLSLSLAFSWRLHGSSALSHFIRRITPRDALLGYFSGLREPMRTIIHLLSLPLFGPIFCPDVHCPYRGCSDWLGCRTLSINARHTKLEVLCTYSVCSVYCTEASLVPTHWIHLWQKGKNNKV